MLARLLILASALAGVAAAEPFGATGAFSNGNGRQLSADAVAGRIAIAAEDKGGRNIWWHVRLDGLPIDRPVTLDVQGLGKEAGDCQPVISYDGTTWERLAQRASPFTFTARQAHAWIARNIPYPYERATALCEELGGSRHATARELARSQQGRSVPLLEITADRAPIASRRLAWVMARQHAFESHSSWVAEGLARWAVSDAAEAERFRQRFLLLVVPVMDVDSVAIGAAGKDQPADFNRVWGVAPALGRPAVEAACALLRATAARQPFAALLDLHDPYFSDDGHWYPPTAEQPGHPAAFRAFLADYVAGLAQAPNAPATALMAASTTGIKSTTARAWAAPLLIADGFAVTMEIAHGKDAKGRFITREGLVAFGAQIGRSLLAQAEAARR